jgi:thioester reductase-like protein
MTTANNRFVTVFGGTGFLGRRAVREYLCIFADRLD